MGVVSSQERLTSTPLASRVSVVGATEMSVAMVAAAQEHRWRVALALAVAAPGVAQAVARRYTAAAWAENSGACHLCACLL